MKFCTVIAILFVSTAIAPSPVVAQELFGVHVVAVNQSHSPVRIAEFVFGKNDHGWHGPRIVAMNQTKKQVENYQLEIQYLAPKGCNVLGTPDAPYEFLTVEQSDPDPLRGGFNHQIPPMSSAESPFDFGADEPFSFLSGNPSAHFPLNLKTGYLHVQIQVTNVYFEDGSSWPMPSDKPDTKIEREKQLYDHDAYDEDRVDCNRWRPVMDRLNENMKWTDVTIEDPRRLDDLGARLERPGKLERLGAELVQTSHGDSAEFLYACAFTQSESFIRATKRAALVCPDLSK
jgi:hypothetical protein